MATSSPVFASTIYTVKPGNTLWGLAQGHHTSIQELKKINHLHSTTIYVGQHLYLLGKHTKKEGKAIASTSTYTVKRGDTLWQLALDHHTSVKELKVLNKLKSDMIYVGEHLRLPKESVNPRNNRRPHSSTIRIGQQLQIPNTMLQGVPSNLIPVYKAAGQKYGIPWTVLAAIHKVETDFGESGTFISSAGAIGPMQFLPSTFAEYGVTAPGQHGKPNINNVYDAIFSTANMLSKEGASDNLRQAIYDYNHSVSYVNSVLRLSEV